MATAIPTPEEGPAQMPGFTTRPQLRGDFGMVASTHWLASATGKIGRAHV